MGDLAFESQQEDENFNYSETFRLALKLKRLLLNEYWIFSGGVERPGSEVDRSPLSSAEVKNEWSYSYITSLRPHIVKSDNISFTSQPNFH